jgi:hypothetical protein
LKFLSAIFLCICINTYAITEPPQLLRACINSKEFIVTLSWQPPTDGCGSFTKYCIYASYNSGPFTKIATIPTLSINEYPHPIPAISTDWRYYITVYNLCNGVDSARSDTLSIDDVYPTNIQLDSVSYDLTTQNIIAGWNINPSADTKGYKIYNFSTGNGDSIGFTTNNFHTVSSNPASRFPVSIATLDSCLLSSLLSDVHQVTYLQGALDTCLNQISLSWNLYIGWNNIDSQTVFVSKNHSPFVRDTTIANLSNTFIYNSFSLGDTIEFYIRSYTKQGAISSSSNRIIFSTRKRVAPVNLYLDNVTVENERIAVNWSVTQQNDVTAFHILAGETALTQSLIYSETINALVVDFKYIDPTADPSIQRIFYTVYAVDNCNDTLDSSNVASNIKLDIYPDLKHNDYSYWDGGVLQYELLHKETLGSTWNTLELSTDPFLVANFESESGCYMVRATEVKNSLNKAAASNSNVLCTLDSLQIFVPTGLNPNSENNRFVVRGKGIDHSKSTYQVYNRWGELIVQNPTDKSWDLSYKDDLIIPGIYIYIVDLYGVLGERRTEKGTVYVFR